MIQMKPDGPIRVGRTVVSNSDRRRLLILASRSPRRAQLLEEHGYRFEVASVPLEEPDEHPPGLPPSHVAMALSHFKAQSVAEHLERGLVLAADTVAALEGRIFGKPKDEDDARAILSALAGTTHEVITGVTLLGLDRGRRFVACDRTLITMRPLREAELHAYLKSGEWRGKAGAYGIQDHGDAFVERIEGSFSNVVGLPMELLARMWARIQSRDEDGDFSLDEAWTPARSDLMIP